MSNKTHNKCGACRHYFKCDSACEHDYACADFKPQGKTVFDRITASPEVLAEKLVYFVTEKAESGVYNHWRSTISCDVWLTKPEAIDATVAKLKEVAE